MNDAQFAALSQYLREIADLLLLRDWEINLEREWADEGVYASVHVWDCENHARVKVCREFFGYPREDQREWLCHELMHAHLDRPHRVMSKLADQYTDHGALHYAKTLHDDEIEICTQRLARITAPYMPLPPEIA